MTQHSVPTGTSPAPITVRLTACPACGRPSMRRFYDVRNVPVHSVLLMDTPEEAIGYPRGDIALGFCEGCGFIANLAFDPGMHEYSAKYEETQGFSSTFSAFHRGLASRLIEKHGLHGKDIIEIGCGKGEFLTMLCEMGNNRGVGFDPAYIPRTEYESGKRHGEVHHRFLFREVYPLSGRFRLL